MGPSLSGYLTFIRDVMGITEEVLPDDSPWIGGTYNVAVNRVNPAIKRFRNADAAYPTPYALAVYNLGGDRLINFATDLPGAENVPSSNPPMPYFEYTRERMKINTYVGGTVQASSDNGTSVSLVVPEAMSNFTLGDLQNSKTPWGRAYLAIAQEYGPSGWGIS